MNYRLATILARTAVATDYTEDIDIDVKDPISQIVVRYDTYNGAEAAVEGYPSECVTKIELIDGSDVLFSLSGVEAQAVDYYHNKVEPANVIRYIGTNYSYSMINLNFGRYLYDPELALDPTKFGNLKLRVTIDRNGGGMASTAGRLTVHAHLFDQKTIAPIGFLMHKEIKNYTLGNDAHEYTDLPTDHPYRKLFIRAQRDSAAMDEQIANIKLSEDVDKVVPINQSMMSLIGAICSQNKPYRETIVNYTSNAIKYYWCAPSYRCVFAVCMYGTTHWGYGSTIADGDGGYYSCINNAAGRNTQLIVEGWLPQATLEIPFGLQNEIDDWYDVTGIGNLKLDITGGGAVDTKTCQIMLQQLRKY